MEFIALPAPKPKPQFLSGLFGSTWGTSGSEEAILGNLLGGSKPSASAGEQGSAGAALAVPTTNVPQILGLASAIASALANGATNQAAAAGSSLFQALPPAAQSSLMGQALNAGQSAVAVALGPVVSASQPTVPQTASQQGSPQQALQCIESGSAFRHLASFLSSRSPWVKSSVSL